jgi:hypothetical protein
VQLVRSGVPTVNMDEFEKEFCEIPNCVGDTWQ